MSSPTLIHIVGQQGAGKSTLAREIIAGLLSRGKTAIALMDEGLQLERITAAQIESHRNVRIYWPFSENAPERLDYLIVEHADALCDGVVLLKGDVVITIATGGNE